MTIILIAIGIVLGSAITIGIECLLDNMESSDE